MILRAAESESAISACRRTISASNSGECVQRAPSQLLRGLQPPARALPTLYLSSQHKQGFLLLSCHLLYGRVALCDGSLVKHGARPLQLSKRAQWPPALWGNTRTLCLSI